MFDTLKLSEKEDFPPIVMKIMRTEFLKPAFYAGTTTAANQYSFPGESNLDNQLPQSKRRGIHVKD